MKAYLGFIKEHYQAVSFGWLLTFFSSFGQTFYISLFVPGLSATFALSNSAFGTYYAAATVIASFFLLRFGHIIDERPVRPFTYKTVALLAVACLLLGLAVHPAMIFVALIGLRLGGQGLMSHISQSVMSRHFDADRGKALSLASLGYSIGEMIFPLMIAGLLVLAGWRVAVISSSGILLVVLLPILSYMKLEIYDAPAVSAKPSKGPDWEYFVELLREKSFWVIALPSFFVPFATTGMFFYQFVMAETRGWSLEWYAFCFTGYAVARLIFSLYGGILNDRFTARVLLPYTLFPFVLGLLCLAWVPGQFSPLLFLIGTGITMGISGVVKPAIIAEVYGVQHIGQVKSLFTVGMVLCSAAGPMLYGFLLDGGGSFSQIAWSNALALFLVALHTFRIKYIDFKPKAEK
ncbi:MAG: MFS transporter [Balneolales bacterium]